MQILIGNLTIDTSEHKTHVDGKPVRLSTRLQSLAELLARHKGMTLSQQYILESMYDGESYLPEIKIIDVCICNLRKKIAKVNDGVTHIETEWGAGYVMRPAPEF